MLQTFFAGTEKVNSFNLIMYIYVLTTNIIMYVTIPPPAHHSLSIVPILCISPRRLGDVHQLMFMILQLLFFFRIDSI